MKTRLLTKDEEKSDSLQDLFSETRVQNIMADFDFFWRRLPEEITQLYSAVSSFTTSKYQELIGDLSSIKSSDGHFRESSDGPSRKSSDDLQSESSDNEVPKPEILPPPTFPAFDYRAYLDNHPHIRDTYSSLFSSEESWVQISEIEPWIYIGGIPYPENDPPQDQNLNKRHAPHSILLEMGIRTIISFSDHEVWWNYGFDITFTHFVVEDSPKIMIMACLPLVLQRIEEARYRRDKVFIHCHAGYSRSVTLLIAYYLSKGLPDNPNPTLVDVVRFVQSKRPFIKPNIGFFSQLIEYEEQLKMRRLADGNV